MKSEQLPVVIAPLLSEKDPTRKVGWAPMRIDVVTLQQREYMRRMKLIRENQNRAKHWSNTKEVAA